MTTTPLTTYLHKLAINADITVGTQTEAPLYPIPTPPYEPPTNPGPGPIPTPWMWPWPPSSEPPCDIFQIPLVISAASTILPDTCTPVTASGGVAPYTLSIVEQSEGHYWLDDWQVCADEDACGAVTIRVTDFCGTTADHSMVSPDGQWSSYIDGCAPGMLGIVPDVASEYAPTYDFTHYWGVYEYKSAVYWQEQATATRNLYGTSNPAQCIVGRPPPFDKTCQECLEYLVNGALNRYGLSHCSDQPEENCGRCFALRMPICGRTPEVSPGPHSCDGMMYKGGYIGAYVPDGWEYTATYGGCGYTYNIRYRTWIC